MKVLLVVDLQNDFCPGGALGISEGDQILPLVNRMLESSDYDLKVATADKHPIDHVSFAVWPIHCVSGTNGAAFHPQLKTGSLDFVVHKGTDARYECYSGFCDVSGTHATELAAIIDQAAAARGEVRADVQITICGLALDYCVVETARDAKKLGYQVEIALDATRAVNQDAAVQLELLREIAREGIGILHQGKPHQMERINRSVAC